MSRVLANVLGECVIAFNELKMEKKHKYIIFKLSDDVKDIVVEETSDDKDWENFRAKLTGRSKDKDVIVEQRPRYAVYDFPYDTEDGREQSKIILIFWSPDDIPSAGPKMKYSMSKNSLKSALNGLASDVEVHEVEDTAYNKVAYAVTGGKFKQRPE